MEADEKIIKAIGKGNPFRVPDNYFDNLSSQIMSKLPEESTQKSVKRTKYRPLIYAACTIATLFILSVFVNHNKSNESTTASGIISQTTTNYSDDMADYLMMDNMDIYACLESESN